MIKVFSHNVWNKKPTEWRNKLIREMITEADADFCTFQECASWTVRSGDAPLDKLMADSYLELMEEIQGKNFTPVYYKKDKFSVIDSGYHAYTGLNDADSKSVCWGVFQDKETGEKIAIASTHFWWMYESEKDNLQRLQNVDELKTVCDEIIKKNNVPVIIGGDFNNGFNADQGDMPYKKMLQVGFSDIRLTAKETTDMLTHHTEPLLKEDGTWENKDMPIRTIDYIFTYGEGIKAEKFQVLTSEKALVSSDHCPLLGYFEF